MNKSYPIPLTNIPGDFNVFRFDGAGGDDDGVDFLFLGEEGEVGDIAQDFLSVDVFIPEAGVVIQESHNTGGILFNIGGDFLEVVLTAHAGAIEDDVFDVFMVIAIQIDGMEFHVEETEKNPFGDHHQGDEGPEENEPFQIAPEENLLQGKIEKHRRKGVSQQQGTYQSHIIFRCGPEPEAVVNTGDHQADKEQERNHQIQGRMTHHAG